MQVIAAILAAGLAISATIGPAAEGTVKHPDQAKPKPAAPAAKPPAPKTTVGGNGNGGGADPGMTGDVRLNQSVSQQNDDVDRRNAQAAADFAKKQAEYQQQQDAYQQAQKDYQKKLADQRAAAQKYEQDKAAWAAKVAACKAGDVSKCS